MSMDVKVQGDLEIVMTRSFDAPLELVWAAHTSAEHLRHWWARGHECDVDLDFRPGGKWRIVEHGPQGERWAFRGEVREIVPMELIVQTFEWEGLPGHISVERLEFAYRDGRTVLTGTSTFANREDRDGMVASGMEHGARDSYRALENHLKTMA
ncbi:SRPBCC family protein [Catellatospora sp. KI3]|uniref:SRPBCC family protein n=1 Tax=Catellatospora sp. KI3 TaxID=3041620 RepID=UPI002482B5E5|nr:SRPBCC family protein [Catellatospora sp. KI3]MDI1461555.1 SRPBCC family protein [Catellatospora sp. KI3]